jgi:ABC-type Mn2+/Zn2+ transport system permease subunit
MRQVRMLASLVSDAVAFFGSWIAYNWDSPVGPQDVVLLGAHRVSFGLSAENHFVKVD